MTFHERAEWERLEALREARYRAFVQRQFEAQQRAAAKSREVLNAQLKRRKQPELEFSI
jgi:hypothetical protein